MKLAVAQFEPKDGNKKYNLSIIDRLTKKAKQQGADVISFHEMSITAYTFMKNLNFSEIKSLAENIPDGKSTRELIKISKRHEIPILGGLLEIENNRFFNTYICVNNGKVIAKFRKLHPFINTYISPGNEYVVFDLL